VLIARSKTQRVSHGTHKLFWKKIHLPQRISATSSSLKDQKDRRTTSRKRHLSHNGATHTSVVESSLTHLLTASDLKIIFSNLYIQIKMDY